MRIKCVTVLATLALVFAAAPSAAQVFCIPVEEEQQSDTDDMAACLAATMTPFGALPTQLPAGLLGRTPTGIGFNASFASMSEEGDAGRRNLAVGIEIPAGRASIGLTGGFVDLTCDVPDGQVECKSSIMLGARFATPLISTAIAGEAGQAFMMGLNGSLGFATGDILEVNFFGETAEIGGRALSAGFGLPLGLVVKSGTITITPFVEPAFFWGRTTLDVSGSAGDEEDSENGTGFALGGGVSFGFANGLSLDVGFKKVMIDEANALIGVGISFQR